MVDTGDWNLAHDGTRLTRTGPILVPSRNDFEDLVAEVERIAETGVTTLVVSGDRPVRVASVADLLEREHDFTSVLINISDGRGTLWSVRLSTGEGHSAEISYAAHREGADLRDLLSKAWGLASFIDQVTHAALPNSPVVVAKTRKELREEAERERRWDLEKVQRAKDRRWNVGGAIAGGVLGGLAGWVAGWISAGNGLP